MAKQPVARGLIVCEQIIVDEGTKNASLINCFTRRLVETFPSPPQRFALHALFSDGQGTIPITVEFLDLATGRTVYTRVIPVFFPDPLQEVRFIFRVVGLVVPAAGQYEVNLSADGESVAATRFEFARTGGGK